MARGAGSLKRGNDSPTPFAQVTANLHKQGPSTQDAAKPAPKKQTTGKKKRH